MVNSKGLICLFLVELWVYAAHAEKSAADKYANIHTVAVISAIGDEFTVTHTNSNNDFLGIDDWRLDDAVKAEVATLLAPRFTIKPITYNRDDFSKPQNSWWPGSEPAIHKTIAGFARADIDAYIVVWKNVANRPTPLLPRERGIGLLADTDGGLASKTLYAHFAVEVIEAKTNRTILKTVAQMRNIGLMELSPPVYPLSEELLPDRNGKLNSEQMSEIKADMTKLVKISLRDTLQDMSLTSQRTD